METPKMARIDEKKDGSSYSPPRTFSIPKINKAKITGTLEHVSRRDREFQELMRDADHTCFFPLANFRRQWRVAAVCMVRPTSEVQENYRQKRGDLKKQRGSHASQETLCFFICKDKAQASKIARYGLRTSSSRNQSLGKPSQGVYLFRYLDVALRSQVKHRTAYIFVFKVILGRIKKLPLSESGTVESIEPTPNFDAHLSLTPLESSDPVPVIFSKSQVYLYEYTDDAVPAEYPRQCLPCALLEFSNGSYHNRNTHSENASTSAAAPVPSLRMLSSENDTHVGRSTLQQPSTKHDFSRSANAVASSSPPSVDSKRLHVEPTQELLAGEMLACDAETDKTSQNGEERVSDTEQLLFPVCLNFQDPRFYEVVGPSSFRMNTSQNTENLLSAVEGLCQNTENPLSIEQGHSDDTSYRQQESHVQSDHLEKKSDFSEPTCHCLHPNGKLPKKNSTISRDPRRRKNTASSEPHSASSEYDPGVGSEPQRQTQGTSTLGVMAVISKFMGGRNLSPEQAETDPGDSWGLTWNRKFDVNDEVRSTDSLQDDHSHQQSSDLVTSVRRIEIQNHPSSFHQLPKKDNAFVHQLEASMERTKAIPSLSLCSMPSSSVSQVNVEGSTNLAETESSRSVQTAAPATSVLSETACAPASQGYLSGALGMLREFTQLAIKTVGLSAQPTSTAEHTGTEFHGYESVQKTVLKTPRYSAWQPPKVSPSETGIRMFSDDPQHDRWNIPAVLNTQCSVSANQTALPGLQQDAPKSAKHDTPGCPAVQPPQTPPELRPKTFTDDSHYSWNGQAVLNTQRPVPANQTALPALSTRPLPSRLVETGYSLLDEISKSDEQKDSDTDIVCYSVPAAGNSTGFEEECSSDMHKIILSALQTSDADEEDRYLYSDSPCVLPVLEISTHAEGNCTEAELVHLSTETGKAPASATAGPVSCGRCAEGSDRESSELPSRSGGIRSCSINMNNTDSPVGIVGQHSDGGLQPPGTAREDRLLKEGGKKNEATSMEMSLQSLFDAAPERLQNGTGHSQQSGKEHKMTCHQVGEVEGGALHTEKGNIKNADIDDFVSNINPEGCTTDRHLETSSEEKESHGENEETETSGLQAIIHVHEEVCMDEADGSSSEQDSVIKQQKSRVQVNGVSQSEDISLSDQSHSMNQHTLSTKQEHSVNESGRSTPQLKHLTEKSKRTTQPESVFENQETIASKHPLSRGFPAEELSNSLTETDQNTAVLSCADTQLNKAPVRPEYSFLQNSPADKEKDTLNDNKENTTTLPHVQKLNKKPIDQRIILQNSPADKQKDTVSNNEENLATLPPVEEQDKRPAEQSIIQEQNKRRAEQSIIQEQEEEGLASEYSGAHSVSTTEHLDGSSETNNIATVLFLQSEKEHSTSPCGNTSQKKNAISQCIASTAGMTEAELAVNSSMIEQAAGLCAQQSMHTDHQGKTSRSANGPKNIKQDEGKADISTWSSKRWDLLMSLRAQTDHVDNKETHSYEVRKVAIATHKGQNAGAVNARQLDSATSTLSGEVGSSNRESRALPLSAVGLKHWLEAIINPRLNPEVMVVDILKAFMGKIKVDVDNCAVCQKVTSVSENDEDEQAGTEETSLCVEPDPAVVPLDCSTVKTAEDSTEVQSAALSLKDPCEELCFTDHAEENISMDHLTEGNQEKSGKETVNDQSTEDSLKDQQAEDILKDQSAEDNLKQQPAEDNLKDRSSVDSLKDQSAEDSLKDRTSVDSLKDPSDADSLKDQSAEDNLNDRSSVDSLKDPSEADSLKDQSAEHSLNDRSSVDSLKDQSAEDSLKDQLAEEQSAENNSTKGERRCSFELSPSSVAQKGNAGVNAVSRQKHEWRWSTTGYFNSKRRYGLGGSVSGGAFASSECPKKHAQPCKRKMLVKKEEKLISSEAQNNKSKTLLAKDIGTGSPIPILISGTGKRLVKKEEKVNSFETQNNRNMTTLEKDIETGSPIPVLESRTGSTQDRRNVCSVLPSHEQDYFCQTSVNPENIYNCMLGDQQQPYPSLTSAPSVVYQQLSFVQMLFPHGPPQHSAENTRQFEPLSEPTDRPSLTCTTQPGTSGKAAGTKRVESGCLQQQSGKKDVMYWFTDIVGEKRKWVPETGPEGVAKRSRRDASVRDKHGLKRKHGESASAETEHAPCDSKQEHKRKSFGETLKANDLESLHCRDEAETSLKHVVSSSDLHRPQQMSESHEPEHRSYDHILQKEHKASPSNYDTHGGHDRVLKSTEKVPPRNNLLAERRMVSSACQSREIADDEGSVMTNQKGKRREDEDDIEDDNERKRRDVKTISQEQPVYAEKQPMLNQVKDRAESSEKYRHYQTPVHSTCADKVKDHFPSAFEKNSPVLDTAEPDKQSVPDPSSLSRIEKDHKTLGCSSLSRNQGSAARQTVQSHADEAQQGENGYLVKGASSNKLFKQTLRKKQYLGSTSHGERVASVLSQTSLNRRLPDFTSDADFSADIYVDFSADVHVSKEIDQISFHVAKSVDSNSRPDPGGALFQENVTMSAQFQENVSTSSKFRENVSTSSQSKENLLCSSQFKENVSTSSQFQENVSTSSQFQENVSTSSQFKENLSCSSRFKENLSGSLKFQENVSTSSEFQENVSGSSQIQENVPCSSKSSWDYVSEDMSISAPATANTNRNCRAGCTSDNTGHTSDNTTPSFNLESFSADQINLELEIISSCFNLVDVICKASDKTDSASPPPFANLVDMDGKTLRKSLGSVTKELQLAIRSIEGKHIGRPHQYLPLELLLPDEANELYTKEGAFVMLIASIPPKAYTKLVDLKTAVETAMKPVKKGSQDKGQIVQLQQQRKIHLQNHTGSISIKLLNQLRKKLGFYTDTQKHLEHVLGQESVAKMTFFRTMFEAVQHHLHVVQREMHRKNKM
ncbi:uncharacterized protein LOC143285001 isoform X2 [Babylonia areolata]|uniref:uncharacterized protein LOC143285001 isoform X2 n=1 Tax=Babylonia areolata TaxID=304850 RepID=UPI003FD53D99